MAGFCARSCPVSRPVDQMIGLMVDQHINPCYKGGPRILPEPFSSLFAGFPRKGPTMKTRRTVATGLLAAAIALASGGTVRAEVTEVALAYQFGIAYLPFMLMRHEKLIEKHLE